MHSKNFQIVRHLHSFCSIVNKESFSRAIVVICKIFPLNFDFSRMETKRANCAQRELCMENLHFRYNFSFLYISKPSNKFHTLRSYLIIQTPFHSDVVQSMNGKEIVAVKKHIQAIGMYIANKMEYGIKNSFKIVSRLLLVMMMIIIMMVSLLFASNHQLFVDFFRRNIN